MFSPAETRGKAVVGKCGTTFICLCSLPTSCFQALPWASHEQLQASQVQADGILKKQGLFSLLVAVSNTALCHGWQGELPFLPSAPRCTRTLPGLCRTSEDSSQHTTALVGRHRRKLRHSGDASHFLYSCYHRNLRQVQFYQWGN